MQRSGVRSSSSPPNHFRLKKVRSTERLGFFIVSLGGLAQLGERLHGMQEVSGSIPLTSTKFQGPLRLEAQDTTLSRSVQRFESARGRHRISRRADFFCPKIPVEEKSRRFRVVRAAARCCCAETIDGTGTMWRRRKASARPPSRTPREAKRRGRQSRSRPGPRERQGSRRWRRSTWRLQQA